MILKGHLSKLLKLKYHIEQHFPNCTVILSQPLLRNDNHANTKRMLDFIKGSNELKLVCLDNSDIGIEQLGKKGLHLNEHGTRRLALNIISLIKCL